MRVPRSIYALTIEEYQKVTAYPSFTKQFFMKLQFHLRPWYMIFSLTSLCSNFAKICEAKKRIEQA